MTAISREDASRRVIVDFEGEGEKQGGELPAPILLGALVPDSEGKKVTYHAWLLDPVLMPVERAAALDGECRHRAVATLEEALGAVLALADRCRGDLAAFSNHERRVIEAHCADEDLRTRFLDRLLNIKRQSDRALKKRHPGTGGSLEEQFRVLFPNGTFQKELEGGAARACRSLVSTARGDKRWSRWTSTQKAVARDLLRYNRHDCRAARKVLTKATSILEADAL